MHRLLKRDVLQILTYMEDVESHTVVFPRTFFSRRALEDEYVGLFLICWLYEEGMHGRALSRFLVPLHMTWGAVHERTTIHAYSRLMQHRTSDPQ